MSQYSTILVWEEGWQGVEDFSEIASRINVLAPEIDVHIVSNLLPNSVTRRKAARMPSLVFSPGRLKVFSPARGRVYQGRAIPKHEQMELLASRGVPVPKSIILRPGVAFDPAEWGSHVIVKPLARGASSHGEGVTVMRTERVCYRAPEDYPPGHPGRSGPMLVQQFIDTGSRPANYRVLTLFGEPLYALHNTSVSDVPALDSADDEIESAQFANNAGERTRGYIDEEDVLELARATHRAVSDIALKGIDIIRDRNTGRLYVIEFNGGGNTWHFSSRTGVATKTEAGGRDALVAQFGAWDVAARVLVDVTRREAE
jgi:hypothetical protein